MTIAAITQMQGSALQSRQYETARQPSWSEYVTGGLLTDHETKILQSLEEKSLNDNKSVEVVATVLTKQISQEVTRYILTCLCGIPGRLILIKEHAESLYPALLSVADRFEGNLTIEIDALWVAGRIIRDNPEALLSPTTFYRYCHRPLCNMVAEECIEVLSLIAFTLEEKRLRALFATDEYLLRDIQEVLIKIPNQPQLQYNALLCFWLVSFDEESSRVLLSRFSNIIPLTVNICRSTPKEKVIRVGAGLWKNLLGTAKDDVMPLLIGSKAIEFISTCLKKQPQDPDLTADLNAVQEHLQDAIARLSTFDEYASEVKSGNLHWSPAHKSHLFWRENAARLQENDCELLRFLDQLGTKRQLMALMAHSDPDVKYYSLNAIQTYVTSGW